MPEPSRRKTSRVATTAAGAAKRAGPEAPTGGAAKGAAPEQPGGGAAKRAAPKPPGRRPLAAVAKEQAAEGLATVAPLASRWMERLLARHDPALTVAQYLALQAVAGGGASGGELARRTGVSGPAVSQLLAALVDGGLVEREASAEDRRRHTLSLSDDGKRALDSARTMLREQFATLLADIPRPEVDALGRLLPFVEAALSGTAPPRRPPPPRPPDRPPGRHQPHRPNR